ncbi:hypothetical protein [Lentzea sp. NPDC059081]|uniref:hypothetical protein n=1 Tax=Lentzea sp. NPDC059081 TaxID=3346719 RepID=UPI0036AF4199
MAIGPGRIGGLLALVVFAMVLTAQSTAATTPPHADDVPAVMRMEYRENGLTAAVHAPRTLVGERKLVLSFRGGDAYAEELARQGFVVVLVDDRLALDGHRDLWRELARGGGPLVERFSGFVGHVVVAEP